MRSISRVADVSINAVSKLLVDAGKFCADLHDREVRNVKSKRVQCDEIWRQRQQSISFDVRRAQPQTHEPIT